MSRIVSVNPAGPLTVAPGQAVEIDILAADVPGDDSGNLRFTASDGSTVTVGVTIDRESLEGILAGNPTANQILAEKIDLPGMLEWVGPIVGGLRVRYTPE